MSELVSPEEVMKYFFKAMARGWVAGAVEFTIPDMPGWKSIPDAEGLFALQDRFCVGADGKSTGFTTIWHKLEGRALVPVWEMQYSGQYVKAAIPFLMTVLKNAYETKQFFGGRGRDCFREGNLVYHNQTRPNRFDNFRGSENIVDVSTDTPLGYHNYSGMWLL